MNRTEEGLAAVPQAPEVKRNAFYSEAEWDVYEVRYQGLGGYPLFAWMSVPKGHGPFPGLIVMPDYASAVSIPYTAFRYHCVVLNPSYRGQRRSDVPFQAYFPGLLTEGIAAPEKYVMGEIYGDAIRAADLLLARPEVQGQPVALMGHGLGATLALVAAALRSKVAAVAAETPLMLGSSTAAKLAEGYPLDEVKDYLRTYSKERDAVIATWESVDFMPLMSQVRCPVLLSIGLQDKALCPPPLGDELAAKLKDVLLHRYPQAAGEGGGYVEFVARNAWLKEKLGLPNLVAPAL
jgi:cephalosporin-C deacetylase